MRDRRRRIGMVILSLTVAAPVALAAQSDSTRGRRPPPHALALAEIGRSGLRGLLSTSGSLGDLQNRAGSYRVAVQMERARVGPLEGRLAALDAALSDPTLSDDERAGMLRLREATLTELHAVPRYAAGYTTGTLQVESLLPLSILGNRPLFLLIRGRGHVRGGGADELTVWSEGLSMGPALMVSPRWIIGVSLGLGRTDVDIDAFDGSSGTTSLGPQLNVGAILGGGWSVAAQLGHAWSHGRSTILRPTRDRPVEVRSEGWSETTTAKAELKGRFALTDRWGPPVVARPRVGAFLTSTHAGPTTNSLGETGTGPFGERESLAAVRAGASLEASAGAWSPTLYLGWERELTDEMSVRVNDPDALLASAGVSWTWSRGRRLVLDYGYLRGLEGLRRVSDLTLVVILDRGSAGARKPDPRRQR